jgi:glycosyltransferase involved in cell wall biosynthesis
VYVESLARELRARGVECLVAAPGGEGAYALDGLPVHRFGGGGGGDDLRQLYGAGDPLAAAAFGRLLESERPDVVHLHAFSSAVSVRLVREARQRGMSVLYTYHTPTASCQRGTLLRWGSDVCDGRLEVHPCARCTLHGLGVPRPWSDLLGSLPTAAGGLAAAAGRSGGPWTALRMTELVARRQAAFRTLTREVERVVVVCEWARELLRRNGVPAGKITVSRHGLPERGPGGPPGGPPAMPPPPEGPLRIAFLGRLDPTKGPHVLLRAIRALPAAPLELHLYGVVQGAAGRAYAGQLEELMTGDRRLAMLPAVPGDQVVARLRGYHVLAVPSQWLETGPLVVLEAFAAGIPVVGSDLGGIAELVEHEVDGLLVEPASTAAWGRALRRLVEERGLLARLRAGVRPPRSMGVVAGEMLSLYHAALRSRTDRPSPETTRP